MEDFTLYDAMEAVEEYLEDSYDQVGLKDPDNLKKGEIKDTIRNAKMTNDYRQNELVDDIEMDHQLTDGDIEEAVEYLRDEVYAAYEEGSIDEDEAATMLEYLDLDNYDL